MSLEQIRQNETQEPLPDLITEKTLKECEKYAEQPEDIEGVRVFMQEYLEEAIRNTEVFESKDLGVSFPYTYVKLSDMARALLEKGGNAEIGPQGLEGEADEQAGGRQEYIFDTFFGIGQGHPYHAIERGMDEIGKKLPEAVKALREHRPFDDLEMYGMGNPVGELGVVSQEFLDKAGNQPFEHLSKAFAEFIAQQNHASKEHQAKTIRLWGVSMGSSVAAAVGSELVHANIGAKNFEESRDTGKPMVRVVMQSPVGADEARRWQIPIGFAADAVGQLVRSSYARSYAKKAGGFMAAVQQRLASADRPLLAHMDDEQKQLKKKLISTSLDEFRSGIPVDKDLSVQQVIGLYDPLMYSSDFNAAARQQRDEHHGSLGQQIVEQEGSVRKFGVARTHDPAMVRENYYKRLLRVGRYLRSVG